MILPVRAVNFQDDLYFQWKKPKEVEMFENCVEQLYIETESEDVKRERNDDTLWSKPKTRSYNKQTNPKTKNKRKNKRDKKRIKHKK